MRRLIIQRLLALVPILFGITFLSFALMHLAGGDAVLARVDASGVQLSAEALAAERARLGLDKPFLVQYLIWLEGFLRGDLGVSYVSGEDVFATFLSKLPATLLLAAMSMLLTLVISIPLGILAAVRQNRATDFLIRAASFVGNSLPNFFVALVLMMLFSIRIPLFPVIAEGTSLASAVLPTLTLAIAMSSRYLRQVRGGAGGAEQGVCARRQSTGHSFSHDAGKKRAARGAVNNRDAAGAVLRQLAGRHGGC